jgi:hypothetical protein
MSLNFQMNQNCLNFLRHLGRQAVPLHHHDLNFPMYQYYPMYRKNLHYLVYLVIPLHHHDLNCHLTPRFLNYLNFLQHLAHLVIPLHHHDLNFLNFH